MGKAEYRQLPERNSENMKVFNTELICGNFSIVEKLPNIYIDLGLTYFYPDSIISILSQIQQFIFTNKNSNTEYEKSPIQSPMILTYYMH